MSILIKPAYDADASTYFTTAGVTSVAGRQQISRFVTGIKDLGLWNDMVCWPLRSSQNAGTGTTAYSLGGLITKNGTLTNGPTWGADGIVFDGANDYIDVPFTEKSGYTTHNFGVIASMPTPTGSRIAMQAGGPWVGTLFSALTPIASEDGNRFEASSYTANTYFLIVYDKIVGSFSGYYNGSSLGTASGSVTLNSSPILIGAYATNLLFWSGTISFAHLFNKSLTAGENLSFYTLYKTTLGQGLGLP